MTRTAKLNYTQISAELKNFSEIARTAKGTYAYATGFYESFLANIIADLPATRQTELLRIVRHASGTINPKLT